MVCFDTVVRPYTVLRRKHEANETHALPAACNAASKGPGVIGVETAIIYESDLSRFKSYGTIPRAT